jgi:hypothetical protein
LRPFAVEILLFSHFPSSSIVPRHLWIAYESSLDLLRELCNSSLGLIRIG